MSTETNKIFSTRSIITLLLGFFTSFFLLNIARQLLLTQFTVADSGRFFFPLSVGGLSLPAPLLTLLQDFFPSLINPQVQYVQTTTFATGSAIAVVSMIGVLTSLNHISPSKTNIKVRLYCLGLVSIIATTSIHGIYNGFIYPISGLRAGKRTHYYHEAQNIESVYRFISEFNNIQPDLLTHSQTHPPGAVLVYYAFQQIIAEPIFVGLSILVLSLFVVFYFHKLIEGSYNRDVATIITAVFIFLPPVQVYFYSALDALIMFVMILTLFYYIEWQESRSVLHLGALTTGLAISLSLTFLGMFLPALFAFHQIDNKIAEPKDILLDGIVVAIPLLMIGSVVYLLTGFNYIEAFITASTIESAKYGGGIYVTSAPVSYLLTRVENIAELILFFGPFCTYLAYKGLRSQLHGLSRFAVYGVAITLCLFLVGTPRTGETARVFLFLYPLLLLPVADYLSDTNVEFSSGRQLIVLVCAQSILMQLFGHYLW